MQKPISQKELKGLEGKNYSCPDSLYAKVIVMDVEGTTIRGCGGAGFPNCENCLDFYDSPSYINQRIEEARLLGPEYKEDIIPESTKSFTQIIAETERFMKKKSRIASKSYRNSEKVHIRGLPHRKGNNLKTI